MSYWGKFYGRRKLWMIYCCTCIEILMAKTITEEENCEWYIAVCVLRFLWLKL